MRNERGKTARPQAVVAQARENLIAIQRARINLLERELRQCVIDLQYVVDYGDELCGIRYREAVVRARAVLGGGPA